MELNDNLRTAECTNVRRRRHMMIKIKIEDEKN